MKISKRFKLRKSQAELDFVDIDTSKDTPLFLDPFFISKRVDPTSIATTRTFRSFFQKVIDLIRAGHNTKAKQLFEHLREPNSTCLGVSADRPRGAGVGDIDAGKIFANLLKSRAVTTGLLQDIEDSVLFIDNFGKDKLSDLTTNVIGRHLLLYTQNQCKLHGIPLTPDVPSGFFWDVSKEEWINGYTERLVIDNRPITLVPKGFVSFSSAYTPEKYRDRFVLEFLVHEHLRINSALVQTRESGKKFVTKKSIKEIHRMPLKEFLRHFTEKHPHLLQKFKDGTKVAPLSNLELADLPLKDICKGLVDTLASIPPGRDHATAFHNAVLGVLELIFYPLLINPVKEKEIHDGRKRIDITFDNAARDGIFHRLHDSMQIPCAYIFIECKNYRDDPTNPEFDQIAGRFSVNRGKVGFLVCRDFSDYSTAIKRCRDASRDGRGLIVPLTDADLIELLQNHSDLDSRYLETFLSNRVREIIVA